jgi:glycosyltransferase involved in cell wall biosynthesis
MGKADYDVVISSHHAFAGSNRLADGGVHLCYVHSPARYVWTPELDSRGSSPALTVARSALKQIDRRAAQRLTSIAANSTAVADRIRRFWDRDARVIHPPVDTEFFAPGDADHAMTLPEGFLLGFGRWIPYKNLDIVIKVAELVQRPAVIAGGGPEGDRLRQLAAAARVPVTVIESPSQVEVRELLRRAAVLIFPTDEDFGIIPVEAQACGTPVVAPARGGALETVVDGRTGALTDSLSAAALADEVDRAVGLDAAAIRQHAMSFSYVRFEAETRTWVAEYTDVA